MPAEPGNAQAELFEGKRFDQYPKWEGQGVPLRENCDLSNPRQKFLWTFTALPGMKGAPLLLPVEYWELVSFRQCVLGADIVREPGLKYQPPLTAANPWLASGKWVPPETPDPARPSMKDIVRKLPQADRAEVRRIVLDEFGVEEERPDVPAGKYRISDLAKRLEQPVDELIGILANFGIRNVKPNTLVDRDIADRIVTHLGL